MEVKKWMPPSDYLSVKYHSSLLYHGFERSVEEFLLSEKVILVCKVNCSPPCIETKHPAFFLYIFYNFFIETESEENLSLTVPKSQILCRMLKWKEDLLLFAHGKVI